MSKNSKRRKRKNDSRRYIMKPDQERQLANFIYGVVSTFKNTRVKKFVDLDSNENEIIVYENEWINVSTSFRLKYTNLLFVIELLLKYHILQQTSNKIFEINSGEDAHNLLTLYKRTDADFQEKLNSLYNAYLDKDSIKNENKITNVEKLIDQNKNAFKTLRYSFFTKIDHNGNPIEGEELTTIIPCLHALFNALYVLSDLVNKKGISGDGRILGTNSFSLPIQ